MNTTTRSITPANEDPKQPQQRQTVEESALGGLLVEITILHAATQQNTVQVLRDAATVYKVDTDAITHKVKQEFAAKEKGSTAKKEAAKTPTKAVKKAKAA